MPHEAGADYSCLKCRLNLPGQQSVAIVRLSDAKGGIWLPALQLFNVCLPFLMQSTSLAAFERLSSGSACNKLVSGPDRVQLVKHGAAQPNSSQVSILKLHAILKKIRPRLNGSGQQLFQQLVNLKDLRLVFPWEGDCDMWKVAEPFPTELPMQTGISRRRHASVSLSKIAPLLLEAKPLKTQLQDFQTWLTNSIQLDRDGHSLAERTWLNVRTSLLQFLGFVHRHCGAALPSLVHLLDIAAHGKLLRHMLEKKASPLTTRSHVYMSVKAISFLQSQPKGKHASLEQLKDWLHRAAGQMQSSLPPRRRDITKLRESGQWEDASDLLSGILKGKSYIEQLAASKHINYDMARDIHDGVMACCVFGFLPPPRLSCLRECTIPTYTGDCMHPDCKEPSVCHGNQLLSPAAGSSCMRFTFPHHKTSIGRQRARPIAFELPQELSDLLKLYLEAGRPRLMQTAKQPTHMFLFMSISGVPLADGTGRSKFTAMFSSWLARHGCNRLPPSLCRHIFVVDRQGAAQLPGPADQDAAVAMGHSEKQWSSGIYNVSKHATAAQAAVDSMAAWRAAHMAVPAARADLLDHAQPSAEDAANEDDDVYFSMSEDDAED